MQKDTSWKLHQFYIATKIPQGMRIRRKPFSLSCRHQNPFCATENFSRNGKIAEKISAEVSKTLRTLYSRETFRFLLKMRGRFVKNKKTPVLKTKLDIACWENLKPCFRTNSIPFEMPHNAKTCKRGIHWVFWKSNLLQKIKNLKGTLWRH